MEKLRMMKIFYGICNVLFLLLGLIVFCVGVYLKVSRSDYMQLLESKQFETGTALMISAGIIVTVVSILGFWGLWMENQFIIGLYFVAVIIIFSIEIAAGILAYIYRGKIEEVLIDDLKAGMKDQNRRSSWDSVQEEYKCCGVNNFTDWEGVYSVLDYNALPDSCCGYTGCGGSGGQVAWQIGCLPDAKEWLEENYFILGIVCVIIGALQLILMISSLSLIFCIRRSKPRYRY